MFSIDHTKRTLLIVASAIALAGCKKEPKSAQAPKNTAPREIPTKQLSIEELKMPPPAKQSSATTPGARSVVPQASELTLTLPTKPTQKPASVSTGVVPSGSSSPEATPESPALPKSPESPTDAPDDKYFTHDEQSRVHADRDMTVSTKIIPSPVRGYTNAHRYLIINTGVTLKIKGVDKNVDANQKVRFISAFSDVNPSREVAVFDNLPEGGKRIPTIITGGRAGKPGDGALNDKVYCEAWIEKGVLHLKVSSSDPLAKEGQWCMLMLVVGNTEGKPHMLVQQAAIPTTRAFSLPTPIRGKPKN